MVMTFLMFGKYSAESLQKMSSQRTKKAMDVVKKCGGTVQAMYATLGEHDLVLVLDFPGIEAALKASVALGKMTGIGFTTAPAVTVAEFDKLVG
jgi:uncharacterized protein with GYD domain